MLGKAKSDAGLLNKYFTPVNPNHKTIIKGELYNVPENYDFKSKTAIFEKADEKKGAK